MGPSDGDQRPPLAVAAELAYQVTSVAMMMALPAAAGYWGNLKLGQPDPGDCSCSAWVGNRNVAIASLCRGAKKSGPKDKPDQKDS